MNTESELSRFRLYYEAPPRGEETERTLQQLARSIRRGLKRVTPLMPYFGKRDRS